MIAGGIPVLSSLLLWLDGSPARYLTMAWIAFAGTAASAVAAKARESRPARWNRPWVFAGLLLLTILAFRWPHLLFNRRLLDPDESQILAGAMTLRDDPRFWRSLDGGTHGPFVAFPLTLASFAGWPLDYTGARTMGALLAWAGLTCTWLSLRSFYGDGTARVAVLPVLAVVAFARFWGFVQFYGEPITALLLAAAVWLLIAPAPGLRASRLFAGGACLGAVPFAKVQGVPIGLWIGLWSLGCLLVERNRAWNERSRAAGWLVAGASLVPVSVLLYVCTTGIWSDFWDGYVLGNFAYADGGEFRGWADAPAALMDMVRMSGSRSFFVPAAIILASCLLPIARFRPAERWRTLFCAGAGRGVALRDDGSAARLPALPPAAVLSDGLRRGRRVGQRPRGRGAGASAGRWAGAMAIAIFLGIGLGPQVHERLHPRTTLQLTAARGIRLGPQVHERQRLPEPLLGRYRATRGSLLATAAGAALQRLGRPGERCAIWGWAPRLYVESRLLQGTRDGSTAWAITGPRTDYYRQRFLADLQREAPALFVDAVGPGSFRFQRRRERGHETFPALGSHVATDYRLVADLDGARIYLRADLIPGRR